jgi:hypothetical protein
MVPTIDNPRGGLVRIALSNLSLQIADEIEDLLVALKRANVIDDKAMVHLLGNYLDEKRAER